VQRVTRVGQGGQRLTALTGPENKRVSRIERGRPCSRIDTGALHRRDLRGAVTRQALARLSSRHKFGQTPRETRTLIPPGRDLTRDLTVLVCPRLHSEEQNAIAPTLRQIPRLDKAPNAPTSRTAPDLTRDRLGVSACSLGAAPPLPPARGSREGAVPVPARPARASESCEWSRPGRPVRPSPASGAGRGPVSGPTGSGCLAGTAPAPGQVVCPTAPTAGLGPAH
jgi:hypothetical protein